MDLDDETLSGNQNLHNLGVIKSTLLHALESGPVEKSVGQK
jgi:hypothetical protein